MQTMITLQSVAFTYPKGRKIYQGLDLSLSAGSIVGLLGRNGEGKSTLMKLMTGQLVAQAGEISLFGQSVSKRPTKLLQQVYMLPEETVVPRITIREYFDIISPFYPSYSEEIASEIISEFEIDWSWNLAKISLGQRKKALIALALALNTPLLLLDEPTNGLDIPSKSIFRHLLARYSNEERLIVISTHQVRDLEQLIDHIVMLDRNQIICNKSIIELTERLHFTTVTPSNKAEAIYSEGAIMGEYGVWARGEEDEDSDFSMELFFNAMIAQKERMQAIINK